MDMKKKKILFHSNHCKAKTGFGRNAKTVLKYLAKTGKYEVIEYCTSIRWGDPELEKLPWKAYGTMPSDAEWRRIQGDPVLSRSVQYGGKYIDEIIKTEKPDVYIGVEDIWAFNGWWNKKWWKNINSILHTTLDSLPILPIAKEAAAKTKNFFVWADFATKGMADLGHDHVKTLHGAFDTDNFYKIEGQDRYDLAKKHGLSHNTFIIGFVFRNQLRKSVPQMLEGFKIFLETHPEALLLLHTCWTEEAVGGWDIPKLIKESGIDNSKILTTYVCRNCGHYHVKPFEGEKLGCDSCGMKEAMYTTSTIKGITEPELNEIYNLMDVYCHPFTSGGQEMPIQEAKLTGLITLVTDYSCGEEYCTEESGGLPLSWAAYREPHTHFIKATTDPESINNQLCKVYDMSPKQVEVMGETAAAFVRDNFDISVIGKQWEKVIDDMPEVTWDFDFAEDEKNPDYQPPEEEDDIKWLQDIYSNILVMEVDENDEGLKHWISQLDKGVSREKILNHFKKVATEDNAKNNKVEFASLVDEDDKGRRIAVVMPESAGDVLMVTSLLPSIKELYPDHNIYFITKAPYRDVVSGNPNIHKVLPWVDACDNIIWMEGSWDNEGLFEVCYLPHVGTQRHLNYLHNGKDIIGLNLKKEPCTS